MCCGGKTAKDPYEVRVNGALLPSHVGSDGRTYPVYAWVVCPDPPAGAKFLLGSDANWGKAQGMAMIAGCPFSGSRSILMDTPARGTWV